MLTVLILIVMACGLIYWASKQNDQTFAKPIKKVETAVKDLVDANNDGKVSLADATAVAKKAGKAAKITAEKVKKTVGRKKKSQ